MKAAFIAPMLLLRTDKLAEGAEWLELFEDAVSDREFRDGQREFAGYA